MILRWLFKMFLRWCSDDFGAYHVPSCAPRVPGKKWTAVTSKNIYCVVVVKLFASISLTAHQKRCRRGQGPLQNDDPKQYGRHHLELLKSDLDGASYGHLTEIIFELYSDYGKSFVYLFYRTWEPVVNQFSKVWDDDTICLLPSRP